MERLIFVTQLIDPDDPVLGFVVPQVRALAAHFDVLVIANEVRSAPDALGADLISLGKEDGRRKLSRGQRYVSAIRSEVRAHRSSAILAHMCPIYVDLAAPFARRYGVPTMLWYVHPADSLTLRVAERLSDAVLTAFPGFVPAPRSEDRADRPRDRHRRRSSGRRRPPAIAATSGCSRSAARRP